MEEATLLWVKDEVRPVGLDEHLEKRHVFLEETTAAELFTTFQLVGPDLVVYSGKNELAAVVDVAEGQSRPVPVVVVVDRKEHRALRQALGSRVGAFVASDLPALALAQRLTTYVQRAKSGQPLEVSPAASMAPTPSAKPVEAKPAVSTPAAKPVETKPTVSTPATKPVEAKPVVSTPAKTAVSTPAKPVEAKPVVSTPAKPVETKPVETKPVVSTPAKTVEAKPVEAKPAAAASAITAAKPAARTTQPPPPLRLTLIDDDLGRADPIATELRARGYDVRLVSPEHGQARWPLLRRFAPQGLIVDERSLSKGTRQIVGAFRRDPFLRYVPLVTIGFARLYRESDQKVHVAPLLPHLEPLARAESAFAHELSTQSELTVDATGLGPARMVELLAELGEPCLLSCESRGQRLAWPLARGRGGQAELIEAPGAAPQSLAAEEALRWLLTEEEPVLTITRRPMLRVSQDVAVAELIDKLSSGLPPPAEFSLLPPAEASTGPSVGDETAVPSASVPASVRIDTAGPVERLSSSELQRLTLEGLAPAPPTSNELPATSKYSQNASVPAGLYSTPYSAAYSAPPPPDLTAPAAPAEKERPAVEAIDAPPAESVDTEPGHSSQPASPNQVARTSVDVASASAEGIELPGVAHRFAPAWRRLRERMAIWGAALERTPPWSRLPRGVALPATAGALLLLLLVGVLVFAMGGSDDSKLQVAAPAPPKKAPVAEPPPPPPAPRLDRFRVAEDAPLRPCSEVTPGVALGDPASGAAFNRARKALMAGDVTAAEADLCRSVLAAPTGPAAEALAEFYLGRRAVNLAKLSLEPALAADPERRKARELMADVRGYEGDADAARALLLATLGLSADDKRVIAAVARKIAGEAEQAARGGDLPRAERLLRRSLLLTPEDAASSLALASVYSRSGLPSAAQAWAERVLELSADHGGALLILGDLARVRGDTDEARKRYAQVKTGDPAHARAVEQLQRLP